MQPTNSTGSIVKKIGIVIMVIGIAGAITLGQSEGWLSTVVYSIVSIVTGSILISLAEIIKLLQEIANKGKE